MKLIILAVFVACCNGAKLNRAYLPPNHAQSSGGSSDILQTPVVGLVNHNDPRNPGHNYKSQAQVNDYSDDGNIFINEDRYQTNDLGSSEHSRAAIDRNAAILRQVNENNDETYSYAFETENGIVAEEHGVASDGVEAQGGYSYTGEDGQVYSVRYTAGHNGFVPEGDHLPTPPPIPEEILKALEQNASDEAAGIYDDGSYSDQKYSNAESGYQTLHFEHVEDHLVVDNAAVNPEAFQTGTGFGNDVSSFSDQLNNGIIKAYLPPAVQRSPGNQYLAPKFENVNHRPSFSSRSGYNY